MHGPPLGSFESGTSSTHHLISQSMARKCWVLLAGVSETNSSTLHSISARNSFLVLWLSDILRRAKVPSCKERWTPPDSLPCCSPMFTCLNSVTLHDITGDATVRVETMQLASGVTTGSGQWRTTWAKCRLPESTRVKNQHTS